MNIKKKKKTTLLTAQMMGCGQGCGRTRMKVTLENGDGGEQEEGKGQLDLEM